VFFNAEAELSLQKYLESRTDNNDALFVSSRKPYNRLCNKAIEDAVAKIANRVGMHVYPHKLRHTFATIGIRSGMSLENLQALMGHAKPETTTIYAHLCEADLQREHAKVYL
jgi:integrase/recombinase XerD